MRWLDRLHEAIGKTFDILDLIVQRLKNLTIQIHKLAIHALLLALALLGALALLREHSPPIVRPTPPTLREQQNGAEPRGPREDIRIIPPPAPSPDAADDERRSSAPRQLSASAPARVA